MPRNPDCQACPLSQTATHKCVWGRAAGGIPAGSPEPFIVGEAPGYQEDVQGQPFIGPSGNLLRSALAEVGIHGYYATNVVKCRSEGPPKPVSTKACAGYLDEEIAQRQPKVILALGSTAWKRLGGVGSITEQAGKEIWSEKYQCHVMPALHPAAILRARGKENAWKLTLARYASLLTNGVHTKPPVPWPAAVTSLVEMIAQLQYMQTVTAPITFDFETNLHPWWHQDFRAYSVAFSWDGQNSVVFPLDHPDQPWASTLQSGGWRTYKLIGQMLNQTFVDSRISKTAHNMLFDTLVWYRLFGYLPYVTCDTMALAHLLDENSPKGLKYLGRVLLGWPDWDVDARKQHAFEKLAEYNGYDAAATWQLRTILLERLEKEPALKAYFSHLLMPGLRALAEIMRTGIAVNRERLADRTAGTEMALQLAKQQIPVDNPGSNDQIAAWLYDQQKLPVLKLTPGGKPSTDEETVNKLARQYPEARKILEYRKPAKNLSTYLLPFAEMAEKSVDGRLHFDYHIGPETGRIASRFHTTPRDPYIRNIFEGAPGNILIQGDYSQIEARLAAWRAAGCPHTWDRVNPAQAGLLLAFRENRDPYKEMAAMALGKPVEKITKHERQLMGKVPTLACLYKISWHGLQEYAWKKFEILWDDQTAQHLHKTFYSLWPELSQWHARDERIILSRGEISNALGRRRRLPDALGSDKTARHEAVNSGINFTIQSLAWEITETAMCLALTGGLSLVGTVHDSLVKESATGDVAQDGPYLRETMLYAPQQLRRLGLRLPEGLLKVDISVGPWGSDVSLEEYLANA